MEINMSIATSKSYADYIISVYGKRHILDHLMQFLEQHPVATLIPGMVQWYDSLKQTHGDFIDHQITLTTVNISEPERKEQTKVCRAMAAEAKKGGVPKHIFFDYAIRCMLASYEAQKDTPVNTVSTNTEEVQ
jgi:hypothetical protein